MKQEQKMKIFLALTSIHRNIANNNNSSKIAWHKEFYNQGYNNPNKVIEIRKALLKMKVIKYNKENDTYSWNKQMTLPNPCLVDGVLHTIKETKKKDTVTIKITVTPPEIFLNGQLLPSNTTSITR